MQIALAAERSEDDSISLSPLKHRDNMKNLKNNLFIKAFFDFKLE